MDRGIEIGGLVMRETLVEQLVDFDPCGQKVEHVLIGWKAIAEAVGFSEDTVQRYCVRLKIVLPKWGPPGLRTPVFLPRQKVTILRKLIFSGV